MTTTYCTLAELKNYLGVTGTSQDALLNQILNDTTVEIETYTRRVFYTYTDTRYYSGWSDTYNNILLLDADLRSVTSIWQASVGTMPASSYSLLPRNGSPKYGILRQDGWPGDAYQTIAVTGQWGYNATGTPPGDIRMAAIRLAAWRFRQKDAPFEATGIQGGDMTFVPAPMPVDIARVLDRYVRLWGAYGV